MPTTKHTPTPWEWMDESGHTYAGEGFYFILQFDGDKQTTIARVPIPIHDLPIPLKQAQANAAFIVRAVNEYDELKRKEKAHDALAEFVEACFKDQSIVNAMPNSTFYNVGLAALKLAKGEG